MQISLVVDFEKVRDKSHKK